MFPAFDHAIEPFEIIVIYFKRTRMHFLVNDVFAAVVDRCSLRKQLIFRDATKGPPTTSEKRVKSLRVRLGSVP